MMYTKFIVFFVISLQTCRLSFSQDYYDDNDDYDYEAKQLRGSTQNATLADTVKIFNASVVQQTSNKRKNAVKKGNNNNNNKPKIDINTNFGGECSTNGKKDCCDDVDYIKQQIKEATNCYKNILSGATTGCANSDEWIRCQVFTDSATNTKSVLAFPKPAQYKTATWQGAKDICASYGASLVTIKTAEKQAIVEQFCAPVVDATAIWMCGYRNPTQAAFQYCDGSLFAAQTFNKWAPGEPNNFQNNENCVDINNQDCGGSPCNWPKFAWNDAPCSWQSLVLCEFPLDLDCTCD